MCGIWASIGWTVDKSVIDVVRHRGPDGAGWREFDQQSTRIVLGHRRLAVFDVSSGGAQPMSSGDGKVHIVFNGAIYNYLELRQRLQQQGVVFRGASDTEVLLNAYAVWGAGCLSELNGMFAFVIYDERRGTVFAARDRFGIKPLYFRSDSDGVGFASEIKQFEKAKRLPRVADKTALLDFLLLGQMDTSERTIFADVWQLRGGEKLELSIDDINRHAGRDDSDWILQRVQRWYDLPTPGSVGRIQAEEAIEMFRDLFIDSVRLRMRSDVGYGFCLSGGLDSSSIVGAARHLSAESLTTFTAAYEDPSVDESHWAKAVVSRANAQSCFTYPTPERLLTEAEKIVHHMDGPFPSTSMFAQWCVFAEVSAGGKKVVLDGQGADEQLAGYLPAVEIYQRTLLRQFQFGRFVKEVLGENSLRGTLTMERVARLLAGLLPVGAGAEVRHQRILKNAPWLRRSAFRGHPRIPSGFVNLQEHLFSQSFVTSLPALLHYEDRMSSAFGVETRLPFLDYRLVEFLIGLGDRFKIKDGETKWLLRQAMGDYLPQEVAMRSDKVGFATPEKQWFCGQLSEIIGSSFSTVASQFPEIINRDKLEQYRQRGLATRQWGDSNPWRFVTLAIWCEKFSVNAAR